MSGGPLSLLSLPRDVLVSVLGFCSLVERFRLVRLVCSTLRLMDAGDLMKDLVDVSRDRSGLFSGPPQPTLDDAVMRECIKLAGGSVRRIYSGTMSVYSRLFPEMISCNGLVSLSLYGGFHETTPLNDYMHGVSTRYRKDIPYTYQVGGDRWGRKTVVPPLGAQRPFSPCKTLRHFVCPSLSFSFFKQVCVRCVQLETLVCSYPFELRSDPSSLLPPGLTRLELLSIVFKGYELEYDSLLSLESLASQCPLLEILRVPITDAVNAQGMEPLSRLTSLRQLRVYRQARSVAPPPVSNFPALTHLLVGDTADLALLTLAPRLEAVALAPAIICNVALPTALVLPRKTLLVRCQTPARPIVEWDCSKCEIFKLHLQYQPGFLRMTPFNWNSLLQIQLNQRSPIRVISLGPLHLDDITITLLASLPLLEHLSLGEGRRFAQPAFAFPAVVFPSLRVLQLMQFPAFVGAGLASCCLGTLETFYFQLSGCPMDSALASFWDRRDKGQWASMIKLLAKSGVLREFDLGCLSIARRSEHDGQFVAEATPRDSRRYKCELISDYVGQFAKLTNESNADV